MVIPEKPYWDLFDYQLVAKDAARKALTRSRRILTIAPTGAGKTVFHCDLAYNMIKKGMRGAVFMDRNRLIKQWSDTLRKGFGIRAGIIQADAQPNPLARLQLCMWQTVQNRTPPPADFVIIDECHEWFDKQQWLSQFYPKNTIWLGTTATPWRSDGQSLGELYAEVIVMDTYDGLIEKGRLVPSRAFAPDTPDLSAVSVNSNGEFNESELTAVMDNKVLVGNAVKHWGTYAKGLIGFVYAVNKKHARNLHQAFQSAGFRAGLVVDDTPEHERDLQIEKLVRRELDVIVNVYIFVKGTDVPELQAMSDNCPTNSVSKYIQMAGRFARISKGKENFLQLDHAGNIERHGLYNAERDYTLGTSSHRTKRDDDPAIATQVCPQCFLAQPSVNKQCPACHHVFEVRKGRDLKEVEGELVEIVQENIHVVITNRKAQWKSQGKIYEMDLQGIGEFAEGKHQIIRFKNQYTYYGKKIEESDQEKAIAWLLNSKAGSEARNQLIAWMRYADKKGYKKSWATQKYKRRYGRWPRMK